ncbi:hypothetical protein KAJ89_04420 [Candidatus Parcubacteria bacterium]|nr:hypothetical protein [Candidatus Parcubacteria bacterium]
MTTKLIKINNNRGILVDNNSDTVVVMLGGFERPTTTKKKFKALADKLLLSSFRFDYSGVGLSDGDFSGTTISSMKNELKDIISELKKLNYKKFIAVAHSLSACVIADMEFEKKILIAPALNQRDLLRYWFSLSVSKKIKPNQAVNWQSYGGYLNEEDFLKDCTREDKMTKQNHISSAYFLENKDKDYSGFITNIDNILHIHGDKDDKVPLESLTIEFSASIIVKNGDHDLERPDMIDKWIDKILNFLQNNL